MMELIKQLPHIEPYGNPQYFLYVITAILPIFIGLFFKKRFGWYEILVSLFFIVTMLTGGKTNQLAALGIYLIWQARMASGYSTSLVFCPSFPSSLSRCNRLLTVHSLSWDS